MRVSDLSFEDWDDLSSKVLDKLMENIGFKNSRSFFRAQLEIFRKGGGAYTSRVSELKALDYLDPCKAILTWFGHISDILEKTFRELPTLQNQDETIRFLVKWRLSRGI